MQFETLAIHDGQAPDPQTGSVTIPIYQTSTFERADLQHHGEFFYSRIGNPTRKALESTIALLENARYGLAFASGVAATLAALQVVKPGEHIVAGSDIYGGSYRIFEQLLRPLGITTTYAENEATSSYEAAITPETRLIWLETPSNPLLQLSDIRSLAALAKNRGILLAVDNTFLSPYFQRPLELGADIVVHSTTKYLGGHSDVIGGSVVTSDATLHTVIKNYQGAAGAIPAPWDCWLILRGIKTLAIRMREHERNALFLAEYLKGHPRVEKIYYPGLASHPQHAVARKQMSGFGGMVSIELKGGFRAVEKFLSKLKLFTLAASLGGVESLVLHPATYSHRILPEKERKKLGISDSLIRLSVGIEHREDLKNDLKLALK